MLNIIMPGFLWLNEDELTSQGVELTDWQNLICRATISYKENSCEIDGEEFLSGYSYSDLIYKIRFPDYVGSLANNLATTLGVSNEYQSFLIAEPTHLRANRDQLLISESELLQLSKEESLSIIWGINQHFASVAKLYYVSESLWLLGLNLDLSTIKSQWYAILDIIGANIDDYLPYGGDAINLIKLLNEIQMLLFNSPLNQLRQKEGLLTINSVWCWDKKLDDKNLVASRDLSLLSNNAILILDDLYYPYCYQDVYSWLNKIKEYNQIVIKPLRRKLANGGVDELNIIIPLMPHASGTIRIKIGKYDKYKIFRRNKINSILGKYNINF